MTIAAPLFGLAAIVLAFGISDAAVKFAEGWAATRDGAAKINRATAHRIRADTNLALERTYREWDAEDTGPAGHTVH
jgi:hypothetical protein